MCNRKVPNRMLFQRPGSLIVHFLSPCRVMNCLKIDQKSVSSHSLPIYHTISSRPVALSVHSLQSPLRKISTLLTFPHSSHFMDIGNFWMGSRQISGTTPAKHTMNRQAVDCVFWTLCNFLLFYSRRFDNLICYALQK